MAATTTSTQQLNALVAATGDGSVTQTTGGQADSSGQVSGQQDGNDDQVSQQENDNESDDGEEVDDCGCECQCCEHRAAACDFCDYYEDDDWVCPDSSPFEWCACEYCWLDMIDIWELNLQHYDRPGYMHKNRECSYKEGARLMLRHNGLLYDICSAQELRGFVRKRGLIDPFPGGLTLKYYYIQVLEEADKHRTFRFMDLPPEMRNEVYRCLLLLRDGDRNGEISQRKLSCFPSILCANQEVYREASDILYGENTIECAFDVSVGRAEARIHNIKAVNATSSTVGTGLWCISNGMSEYPEFLRRVRHLKINATDEIPRDPKMSGQYHYRLNQALATLASFLMDEHSLKSLHLDLKFDRRSDPLGLATVLYPLRRLRNIPVFQITGDVPKSMLKTMAEEMSGSTLGLNTMKVYDLLEDESARLAALVEGLHADFHHVTGNCTCKGYGCGECGEPPFWREMCNARGRLDEFSHESFYSSELERRTQRLLRNLRQSIHAADVEGLLWQAQKLHEVKTARVAYETSKTDAQFGWLGSTPTRESTPFDTNIEDDWDAAAWRD